MRITKLKIEGFRSIKSVSLDDLGTFNVFYGPNGAGKSNLLAASGLVFALAAEAARRHGRTHAITNSPDRLDKPGRTSQLRRSDLHHGAGHILFAAKVEATGQPLLEIGRLRFSAVEVTVRCSRAPKAHIVAVEGWLTEGQTIDLMAPLHAKRPQFVWQEALEEAQLGDKAPNHREAKQRLLRFLREDLPTQAYRLIPAIRELAPEVQDTASAVMKTSDDEANHLSTLLASGRIAEALVTASNHPSPDVRRGFRQLTKLFEGPPLHRPALEPVFDPVAKTFDLQEVHEEADGSLRATSVGDQGLGVQQLYVILGSLLLGSTHAAGLEEPEAHLHAPTSGRHLRELLKRVVQEGYVQQLFIATHSNLFDLDTEAWYDVSLVDGETRVERRTDWAEVDRKHLYEPGPARHALMDLLQYLPEDTPVFRRPDGSAVSGPEMVRMLIDDDPVAFAFLEDVHAAAVRAVQLRSSQ